MEVSGHIPEGFVGNQILRSSPIGMIVQDDFGELIAQVPDLGLFASTQDGQLVVAATPTGQSVRCFSATGNVTDVTVQDDEEPADD